MSITMNDIRREAEEGVDEIPAYDLTANPNVDEYIWEIADGCVPVYNADLFALAADDPNVGLGEPEIGPAFDGSPTPVNIIAANVYEAARDAASERLRERIDEQEEIDWDYECAIEEYEVVKEAREIIDRACFGWYLDNFAREMKLR